MGRKCSSEEPGAEIRPGERLVCGFSKTCLEVCDFSSADQSFVREGDGIAGCIEAGGGEFQAGNAASIVASVGKPTEVRVCGIEPRSGTAWRSPECAVEGREGSNGSAEDFDFREFGEIVEIDAVIRRKGVEGEVEPEKGAFGELNASAEWEDMVVESGDEGLVKEKRFASRAKFFDGSELLGRRFKGDSSPGEGQAERVVTEMLIADSGEFGLKLDTTRVGWIASFSAIESD